MNERTAGVGAPAAPVFDDRDRVIGSVGVVASPALVSDPPPAPLLAQVRQSAATISAELRSTAWAQSGIRLTRAKKSA